MDEILTFGNHADAAEAAKLYNAAICGSDNIVRLAHNEYAAPTAKPTYSRTTKTWRVLITRYTYDGDTKEYLTDETYRRVDSLVNWEKYF